jgi:solute:Na+ symporter, SSS family
MTALAAHVREFTSWIHGSTLGCLDWSIILGYCALTLAIGLYFTRRAGKNTDEYFVTGRSMGWGILGLSMIATSFASDTPLAVASLVRSRGVWANWWWISFAISQLMAVFSFSLFWRRAEVVTDNQLIEMRYSGRPAAVLRGFKAAFGATIYNFIVMGWILNSIGTVAEVVVGVPKVTAIVIFSLITLVYGAAGGIYATIWTDVIQFLIMLCGMIVLSFYAVGAVGGLGHMREALANNPHMTFLPTVDHAPGAPMHGLSAIFDFLTWMLIGWWASLNADGGGYLIQRMAAAKNERHSQLATMVFVIGMYVIRLWPMVLVVAASLLLYPAIAGSPLASDPVIRDLGDKAAFPLVMKEVLKHPGLIGLLLTAFVAAFMSTISTHLNWGASYMIHDLYRRFVVRKASDKHYVRISYAANVVILACAGLVAAYISKIEGAWEFVRVTGAGVGVILILRWFWWRVNAWTEIAALATSLGVTLIFEALAVYQALVVNRVEYKLFSTPCELCGVTWDFAAKLFVIIPLSFAAGLIATYATAPTDRSRLVAFFRKVRPGGAWGSIPTEAGVKGEGLSWSGIRGWLASVGFIYCLTFGIGKLIFGPTWQGWALIAASILFGVLTWIAMKSVGTPQGAGRGSAGAPAQAREESGVAR